MATADIKNIPFADLEPTQQGAVQAALIAKVIADDIGPVREKANAKAAKVLDPGEAVQVEINGEVVGNVTYKRATSKALVTPDFLPFVEETFPEEVTSEWVIAPGAVDQVIAYFKEHGQTALLEERRIVRPEFQKRLLKDVKETEKGVVDTVTGEFIKGIAFATGSKAAIAVTNAAQAQKDALAKIKGTAGYAKIVKHLLGLPA